MTLVHALAQLSVEKTRPLLNSTDIYSASVYDTVRCLYRSHLCVAHIR